MTLCIAITKFEDHFVSSMQSSDSNIEKGRLPEIPGDGPKTNRLVDYATNVENWLL